MHRIVAPFLLIFGSLLLHAQRQQLTETLRDLSEQSGISFSYDADLLKEASLDQIPSSVDELEKLFNENSALRIEKISGTEWLIVPKRTKILFSFVGAEEAKLEEFYVDIIHGDREVLYQNFISRPQEPISFDWTPQPGDTIRIISTAHDPVAISLHELLFDTDKQLVLREKVTYLEEVVINNYLSKGISMDVPNQTTNIQMSELALIPGETDGDVLASLATLPGINSPDSRAGNLYIRGSSSDQNFMLYNNIPIYHRGHYFGSISPYNPAVISNVSVSKNGYNPRLGGRVGGAIEIRSQDELKDYSEYGVGLNSLYGNAFVKTRLGRKIGLSAAGRHSLPSTFLSPKLVQLSEVVYAATALSDPQQPFSLEDVDVTYEDYNLNLLFVPNGDNTIKLSGLYTDNNTDYLTTTDTTINQEAFAFDNVGLSVEWDRAFSSKTAGKFISFYSRYGTKYVKTIDQITPNGTPTVANSENEVKDLGVSYELKINRASGKELSLGASGQRTEVTYMELSGGRDRPPLFIQGKESASVLAGFANYKYSGSGKFYFQLGSRLDYYTYTSAFYYSPRLLMNYDLSGSLILKASAGRYYQYLNQIKYLQFGNAGFDNEMWRLAGSGNIEPLHSDQFMIGGILTKGAWLFDIEGYKKRIGNVNYATTFELNPMTEYDQAEWDIVGVDLFAKVQVSNSFSVWGSYEYSQQEITFDSLESVSYTYKYNRPHRFKLGGLYQKGRWKLSFSWKLLSGLYGRSLDILTDLDQIVIREIRQNPPPPPPGGGSGPPPRVVVRPATIDDIPERYPNYKGLDLFVTYELPKTARRKWSANFGLSLINVFDYQNIIDQVARGGGDGNPRTLLQRNATGFAPNLNVTIKW